MVDNGHVRTGRMPLIQHLCLIIGDEIGMCTTNLISLMLQTSELQHSYSKRKQFVFLDSTT